LSKPMYIIMLHGLNTHVPSNNGMRVEIHILINKYKTKQVIQYIPYFWEKTVTMWNGTGLGTYHTLYSYKTELAWEQSTLYTATTTHQTQNQLTVKCSQVTSLYTIRSLDKPCPISVCLQETNSSSIQSVFRIAPPAPIGQRANRLQLVSCG
jgi:hypothetical protein